MKLSARHLFYLGVIAVGGWALYLVRGTLAPFVLAAAFAYLLNPWVTFLTTRAGLPRGLSIAIIYFTLIGILAGLVFFVGRNLTLESEQFARETRIFVHEANSTIASLPDWFQPLVQDSFESARSSLLYPQKRIVTSLPGAVNRTISVLVFIMASFYFLRDGQKFVKNFLQLLPSKVAYEIQLILQKINGVLGNYLRGQLFLVVIMSTFTFIGLSIIGLRYALIVSVFTGFAELIPFVGPVIAAVVAMTIAFTDEVSRFSFVPMVDLIAVGALYFVLRQMEDLFIIPQVLGRMTKLHPVVVLFVVLAGGHLFGLLGYVAAVPIVASLKVVIEHLHQILGNSHKKALRDS